MILGKGAFMPCNFLEPPYNGIFLRLLNVIHNLVVRHDLFILSFANDEGPKDILDSAADFDFGTVANKLGGSTIASNHILHGVDKCLFGFQGIYNTDSGG
jgi:hypothetical protein